MQVHHLSHIDLDGYGAQLVAKECFEDIIFYNANYGREVEVRLSNMLHHIRQERDKDFLILITDLNLTPREAKNIQDDVNRLNLSGKNITLRLYDHHITGKECADIHDWYFLDVNMCASKITFCKLQEEFGFKPKSWLEPFVEMINSADMWCESGFAFDFGKVALGMIAQSKEFSRFMFDDYDRIFKFNMLYRARDYLLDSNNTLRLGANVSLDNNIFLFKKELLGGDKNTQTMEEILSIKQAKLLQENKKKYTITYLNKYEEKQGLLAYGIGGISILANLFLKNNPEYDFFMDISSRGSVSLRANNNCDVSQIAKEFFNGGGHKNASGGKFMDFRETFLYDEAKEQVEFVLEGGMNG